MIENQDPARLAGMRVRIYADDTTPWYEEHKQYHGKFGTILVSYQESKKDEWDMVKLDGQELPVVFNDCEITEEKDAQDDSE
jgi:hypothetical protein